jgi:hypothetical protein
MPNVYVNFRLLFYLSVYRSLSTLSHEAKFLKECGFDSILQHLPVMFQLHVQ